MEENEFIVNSNYQVKIKIIKASQNEYINIYIKNNSKDEEYIANFDYDFLRRKAFFQCCNLEIIKLIFIKCIKDSKIEIIQKYENEIECSFLLNEDNKKLKLIIPKYNKNEVMDIQDIIGLKTLYTNLKSEYEKIIGKVDNGETPTPNDGHNYFRGFTNKIIKNVDEANTLLGWIDKKPNIILKVKLLYSPTLEENSWQDFHKYCDNKGPTIVLCEELTKGRRFGGYASISWDLKNQQYRDNDSFLFSLDNNKKYTGRDKYIYTGPKHGIHFGYANLALIWHSDLGFIGPNQDNHTLERTEYFDVPKGGLSGGEKFTLKNMEVYQVIFEDI